MLAVLALHSQESKGGPVWAFSDATNSAAAEVDHRRIEVPGTLTQRAAGGVAAGDYDRDGNVDLYVVAGDGASNALLRNRGQGSFEEVSALAGVALEHVNGSGPLFFDFDGDGWLDLFVGATDGSSPSLFQNRQDGTFSDVTASVGLASLAGVISASAGDYDGDGWLDLFLSHWGSAEDACHLWKNEGGRHFACVDEKAGIAPFTIDGVLDRSFSANFVDIDRDGDQDLLVASDFATSRVLRNQGGGHFEPWLSLVISDENGMGSAIGDYDGDGAFDWFVSSVWDADSVAEGDWGMSGNRLYRNLGDGTFEDVTDVAGVREGDWGWATCFADLNQDGMLDLVQVNGWPQGSPQFRDTPARLFVAQSVGRFSEQAESLGFVERGGGRGLSCFDYDGDGDLDLFVMNNDAPSKLWRNDAPPFSNTLRVKLEGPSPNSEGIGAVIRITAGGREQLRAVRAGSNYASQDPAEVHFGLGAATLVDRVDVEWPGGAHTSLRNVSANQRLIVQEPPRVELQPSGGMGCSGR
ncbi:MAG TPA: CRTAC1 family protein [Polyangiaceae bacterium]|jgi:hypothetical protein|nr:CRTAC1 family protein [Polyangiaceae bacterium]